MASERKIRHEEMPELDSKEEEEELEAWNDGAREGQEDGYDEPREEHSDDIE